MQKVCLIILGRGGGEDLEGSQAKTTQFSDVNLLNMCMHAYFYFTSQQSHDYSRVSQIDTNFDFIHAGFHVLLGILRLPIIPIFCQTPI